VARRTLVELLSQTRALQATRNMAAQRISLAKAEAAAPRPPLAAIGAYQTAADNYAVRVQRLVERHVLERLPVLGSGDELDRTGLELGLAALQLDMVALAGRMRIPARAAARRGADHARKEVSRILNVKLPESPHLRVLAEDFAADNVRLFQRIAADQAERIRKAIADHQEGDSLREDILHTLWVARNRSRLIASDQVYRLQSAQIQSWARGGGSTHYVHVTRADERVRRSHRPHHGKTFSWAEPPPIGLPGHEPGCRCVPLPVEALVLP
jgi:SPP1 gp7 family putative phage head morphogenesis protein